MRCEKFDRYQTPYVSEEDGGVIEVVGDFDDYCGKAAAMGHSPLMPLRELWVDVLPDVFIAGAARLGFLYLGGYRPIRRTLILIMSREDP